MKKLLSLFLILALLLSLLPAALAEDIELVEPAGDVIPVEPEAEITAMSGYCGDNLSWSLNNYGELSVSGTGPMYDYNVGTAPWYNNRSDIKKVYINAGVESIGRWAFYMCENLTYVSTPSSLLVIADNAFNYCRNLSTVELSLGLQVIGSWSFYLCSRLSTIPLPGTLRKLGGGAFKGCSSLQTVEIPASVTTIEDGVFGGCTGLTAINVAAKNDNYKSADGVLFSKDGKTLLAYPTGRTAASYTVPSGVTVLGGNAFEGCAALRSVSLPEGLLHIKGYALADTGLTGLTIPASVQEISGGAFRHCNSLTAIGVASGSKHFKSAEGVLLSKDGKLLCAYPSGKADEVYSIPEGVREIQDSAFENLLTLRKLIFPASVTKLSGGCFFGCSGLKTIRFVGSAPDIDGLAFFNVTATVYYPGGDGSWTADKRQDYSGRLTWLVYEPAPGPVLHAGQQSTDGLSLGWTAFEGAAKYELQRKESGGSWKTLKSLTASEYTDASAQMGVTYVYRVRALVEGDWTAWSDTVKLSFQPFSDVSGNKTIQYVAWAYNNDIVKGTGKTSFSPDKPCTRIQFVMMLWKMHGSPAVEGENPFSDISGAKTTRAILWALKAGVINSGSRFDPDGNISRIQIVMMLWKLAGSPKVTGENPFTDVSGTKTTYAVLWAYQNGITKGTGADTFSPDRDCTRVQLVIFLYKYNEIYSVI